MMETTSAESSGKPPGPDHLAIQVEGLEKRFGSVRAVDGISFGVEWGEIFGLLGHNGAGKTTTIRMLTGRARPSGGRALVAGFDSTKQRERVKPLINAVFEGQNLYERLTGRETLSLFCGLYGQPASRISQVLEIVELAEDDARRKVREYSTGMRQRLLVARALVNHPKILFCDEPTRGLDPAAARKLRNVLATLAAEESVTVFLTTHDMDDADELCRRVAFITEGKLVALDSPRELKLRHTGRTARVLLEDRSEHRIHVDAPEDARRLETWMRDGLVISLHTEEPTLKDVFVELAGRPL